MLYLKKSRKKHRGEHYIVLEESCIGKNNQTMMSSKLKEDHFENKIQYAEIKLSHTQSH